MPRFAVISWDEDQKQNALDYVRADDPHAARRFVESKRGSFESVIALTPDFLRNLANELSRLSEEELTEGMGDIGTE